MGLFRIRTRPKHKILVNIDLAVQDCQKNLNDAEKAHERSVAFDKAEHGGTGIVKSGTSTGYYGDKRDAFEKLKERLLKDIKDIDDEIDKWEEASAAATGISGPPRRRK